MGGQMSSRTGSVTRLGRRLTVAALGVALGAGIALVGPAHQAQAAFTAMFPASWAATDIRSPDDVQLDPAGNLHVGAWRDEHGRRHISRAYFTFDVSEVTGRHIYSAELILSEAAATNCANRQLEVWATDAVTADTSWVDRPTQLTQLPPGDFHEPEPCPAPFITWQATSALRDTVAIGDQALTVEVAVPRRYMADTELGRQLAVGGAFLSVEYETLPLPRPRVSSPAYPEDPAGPVLGAGIPGEFTFDAEGNPDVVGFQYVWNDVFGVGDPFSSDNFVPADAPGGSATLMLAPPLALVNHLFVRSVRADGQTGAVTTYRVNVLDTAPLVTWDPDQVAVGVPFPIAFTPVVADVVAYEYRVELAGGPEGPPATVPAGPDGTATAMITLAEPGPYVVLARSVHPDWTSPYSRFVLSA